MKSNASKTRKWNKLVLIAGLAVAVATGIAVIRIGSGKLTDKSQTTFHSPVEAGAALEKAAKNGDEAALAKILGVDPKALLTAGDQEADKAAMQAFASGYKKMNRWVDMTDSSRVLYIGADNFAFPVPLAKNSSGQWYFDGVAGAEEVRAREIGRNELLAIDACTALGDAQEMYFADSGYTGFARRIISTSGKQDGLYWPASDKQNSSPLASLDELPKSSLRSLSPDQPLVVDGYKLRILTAQGDDAPGGARSYIVDGRMTGGFAVLATPVNYGETGIMTFMSGMDGVVYERDLGRDTAKIAASIQKFNPSDDWLRVE
ncbi:MAG: DUF2950 family protein [Candidatus Sulfotelmatobacter sp.]|jgi:hypothetical protein